MASPQAARHRQDSWFSPMLPAGGGDGLILFCFVVLYLVLAGPGSFDAKMKRI
ncbi:hypothetical protein RTCIAT899_PB00550 (plasmid) [Rhizobium tropici CIAT 899]|nr:hypothetical protein RTCIAT899_PB00550 [Rhizobium tropici CIAT 899]